MNLNTLMEPNRWQRSVKPWRKLASAPARLPQPFLSSLHLVVAILLTIKIAAVVREDTPFIVASTATFSDMFLAGVQRHGEIGLLYEIDDCVASINRTIDTYFKLPRTGLDVYDALSTPVQINVVQFSTNPRRALPDKKGQAGKLKGLDFQTWSGNITSRSDSWLDLLGIDGERKLRAFFNSLVQMEIVLVLRTLHRELDHVQAFDWEITALYDFVGRGGRIELSLSVDGSHVHQDQSWHWELLMDMLLGGLALLSESSAYLRGESLLCYLRSSRQWRSNYKWRVVTTSANVTTWAAIILEVGEFMAYSGETRGITAIFTGMACMLAWLKIIEHLEPLSPYNTLILAMRQGVPVVLVFLIGSTPLLMGFAGLGMALFSEHSDKFSSLKNSCITLFAILNGDVLLETSRDIQAAGNIGDVFLVTFVCIFVYSGLNVFISIIQDAYSSAKEQTGRLSRPSSAADVRSWEGLEGGLSRTGSGVGVTAVQLNQVEARLREQMADLQKQLAEVTALLSSGRQAFSTGGVKEHGGGYFSDGETPRHMHRQGGHVDHVGVSSSSRQKGL
ncbi:hypothetical protein KFL_000560160 [Klebsormidium nitens]|uniref:Polycystin cation channel PKD1/PKD2 domain-containing protein n=1 Tax=Klebsormidium nitens TaxID=105231 RepID=A0A1Y1HVH0_KLENI|nr:hypothetical protein KFL_000560160 [Klebsormidium nitens]|eukprot:GAQ80526.1 hypothetical protein KFL_000560160 [Klebsormidium nitens]